MPVEVLKTKICLVGESAVGKTSLIRRFVIDAFDDKYEMTLGAKVTKKVLGIPVPEKDIDIQMDMTIWDIVGKAAFRELLMDAYFYGARGILAVADLTRRTSLINLVGWIDAVVRVVGRVPTLIAVNKADLAKQADFGTEEIRNIADAIGGAACLITSAKTGERVEEAFMDLATTVARRQLDGYV